METTRVLSILGLALAVIFAGACATVDGVPAVPLPTEIKINPPTPETPKELASCLGAWGGWWAWTGTGHTTETALIVERIDAKSALVVYARGRGIDGSPGWWRRFFATVEGNSIVLRFGSIVRTFTCKGNWIAGTYEEGPETAYATLTKFTLAAAPSVKAEPAAVETTAEPATAEKLIAGSPFSGTATFPAGTFEIEFSYSRDDDGRLKGALTRTTSNVSGPGPLKQVKAKKGGKVTFYTEIGVYYQLEFDRDGNLTGDARSGFGDGSVKLSPAKR